MPIGVGIRFRFNMTLHYTLRGNLVKRYETSGLISKIASQRVF